MDFDVLIVGAGVSGCAIARELARYKVSVAILERGVSVASGATRANSAIVHAGYDCVPGTLMARLNILGNRMMGPLCEALSVPFRKTGSLVLAFDRKQEEHLSRLREQGEQSGVPDLQILDGRKALEREPALNPSVTAALWAPTAGIVCPYELALALAESAVENGAALRTGWEVASIQIIEGGLRAVSATGERVTARYLVNAAGVHADAVSEMAGGIHYKILPRRGEYMVLDRSEGSMVRHVIFQTPSALGKGVLVTPTVHGNLLIGPTASD
ncbi:MAG: NAD(P)/FAD-dependent oxidoreductase, partial [Clostridiales bacterium]|nr:NAD(P)/FAD-dependent oxidoreductase [Clostridiales bacterium]